MAFEEVLIIKVTIKVPYDLGDVEIPQKFRHLVGGRKIIKAGSKHEVRFPTKQNSVKADLRNFCLTFPKIKTDSTVCGINQYD